MLNLRQELHAEHRQFQTVAGAMLWYAERRSRKEGSAIPLEVGVVPRSEHERAVAEATYAKIAACLAERDPADYAFDPPLTEWRIASYLHWCRSDESTHDLADRAGMTGPVFDRERRRTRNLLRRRFREAGLLA